MIDLGAAVIPIDLVTKMMKTTETQGWPGGVFDESERLFIITSALIGPDQTESMMKARLQSHFVFTIGQSEPREQVLRWSTSGQRFLGRFREMWLPNRGELEEALGTTLEDQFD